MTCGDPADISVVRTVLPLALTWLFFIACDIPARIAGFQLLIYGAFAWEGAGELLKAYSPCGADATCDLALYAVRVIFLLASWWCLDRMRRSHRGRRRRRRPNVPGALDADFRRQNRRTMERALVEMGGAPVGQQSDVWCDCPESASAQAVKGQ